MSLAHRRAATSQAAQGIPYREVLPYSWADGTERLVDFALYPIRDNKGNLQAAAFTQALYIPAQGLCQSSLIKQRRMQQVRHGAYFLAQLLNQLHTFLGVLGGHGWVFGRVLNRLGQSQHDSAGQILTALGMVSSRKPPRFIKRRTSSTKDASPFSKTLSARGPQMSQISPQTSAAGRPSVQGCLARLRTWM